MAYEPPPGAPLDVFAECADWLLVIGGSAVQFYGVPRMTFDSDCAILARDEPRLRTALGRLGYIRDDEQTTFTRYRHLNGSRPIVDAMLLDADTLSKLWSESRLVTILGLLVRVPAPIHLIAMKLHALKQQPDREYKDWPDICYLIQHHSHSWTPEAFEATVVRYASEKSARQLRDQKLHES